MGTWGIHQNIPASDAELTPGFGIDYISPPLVMEKLIPVNSREITRPPTMSLLLEVERMPAIIDRWSMIGNFDKAMATKDRNEYESKGR